MGGGPLWITEGGRAVLVGIVVRGLECLKQNSTGIYTMGKILTDRRLRPNPH